MQATVRDWHPESGGSASLDDGRTVVLPPEALEGSGFRFLRVGQRVRLHLDETGGVSRVELP